MARRRRALELPVDDVVDEEEPPAWFVEDWEPHLAAAEPPTGDESALADRARWLWGYFLELGMVRR